VARSTPKPALSNFPSSSKQAYPSAYDQQTYVVDPLTSWVPVIKNVTLPSPSASQPTTALVLLGTPGVESGNEGVEASH
jgi:hypothetical protein